MKLKCEAHNRRVLCVSSSSQFVHRTGDNSDCDSKKAVMVDNTSNITRSYVVMAEKDDPNAFYLAPVGVDKVAQTFNESDTIDLKRYTRRLEN